MIWIMFDSWLHIWGVLAEGTTRTIGMKAASGDTSVYDVIVIP